MVGVRQFDEEAMLAAALEVFWRRGLSGTSMADVAAATGVQRGSLYHAYGAKERIFLLAFDRYAERFLGTVRAVLAQHDVRDALLAFFEAGIANMTGGDPPRGCLTTRTATEAVRVGPAVQARLRRLLEDLEAALTEALAAPAWAGRLAAEPAAVARLVVTFTRGLAVMQCAYGDPDRLRATARDFVATLVRDPG